MRGQSGFGLASARGTSVRNQATPPATVTTQAHSRPSHALSFFLDL
jgi:hypothetical protein